MATITVSPGAVTHTLSNQFFATYLSPFFHQDYALTAFQDLFEAVGFEYLRVITRAESKTSAALKWANFKTFCLATAPPVVNMCFHGIRVGTRPANPFSAGIAADGSGYGADDWADLYEEWVNAGINVGVIEVGNEVAYGADPNGPIASAQGTIWPPTDFDYNWVVDWCAYMHRLYANVFDARAAALSRTLKVELGCYDGNFFDTKLNNTKKLIGPSTLKGFTWPYADTNVPHMERVAIHTYGGANDEQSAINNFFFKGVGLSGTSPGAYPTNFQNIAALRNHLDSLTGGSTVEIGVTEVSFFDRAATTYRSGTGDAAIAVAACRDAGTWKLNQVVYTAYNRGRSTDNGDIFAGNPAIPNVRYYTLRDIVGRYEKNYKTQVSVETTGSGATPASIGNSIDRIQAVAGKKTGVLAVLVVNCDFTNGESVTISAGQAIQGQVTGIFLPQNHPNTLTPLPSIAPITPTGQTFSKTIGPGEVYLFEIPLAPGDPQPPEPGTDAHLGNWTVAVQVNAAAAGPPPDPPSPDQHLGNWTTAVQINAEKDELDLPSIIAGSLTLEAVSPASLTLTPLLPI